MSRKLTPGEKLALREFADWERDQVTNAKAARTRGLTLLSRLRAAGVRMYKVEPKPRRRGFIKS